VSAADRPDAPAIVRRYTHQVAFSRRIIGEAPRPYLAVLLRDLFRQFIIGFDVLGQCLLLEPLP
jgi:hypothetical protein